MMTDYIEIECRDIKDFQPHENRAVMVVNPPYGERLVSENLLATYKTLGERLKHAFQGKYSGFRDEGGALQKDFAPMKRKSRLTGLDGEVKGARRERNNDADGEMTPEDIAMMKRRRELESYFKSRDNKREKPFRQHGERPERGGDDSSRGKSSFNRDRKPSFGGGSRSGERNYGSRGTSQRRDGGKPGRPDRRKK